MNIFKQITANNIVLNEYPFWKELAMEAYLLENEEILRLDKENFSEVSVLDAEIHLKDGRRDRNGRIDILAKYSAEYLAIVEIKLEEINDASLTQLEHYLDKKEQLLDDNKDYWTEEVSPKWVGILIGRRISSDLREKLLMGYKYGEIPIAGITINRFRGDKNEIYVVSDTYFKFQYSSKDYSRFIFHGIKYNKARLVNAVIKFYVEKNPAITFAELMRVFPKSIQGSFGVFDTKENANDIFQRWGHKRHYIKPEEEIVLMDETICTCTQWNPVNIKSFLNTSNQLGLKIEIE